MTEVGERFPAADIEYDVVGDPAGPIDVQVIDEKLFEMSLIELVENSILHNDQERPRVRIQLSRHAEQVRVDVADNGPGIPDDETDILDHRTETALSHSSGLGLWLVKWTVSLSEGSLTFADNQPRGSVVTLTFPATTEAADPDRESSADR